MFLRKYSETFPVISLSGFNDNRIKTVIIEQYKMTVFERSNLSKNKKRFHMSSLHSPATIIAIHRNYFFYLKKAP